MRYYYLIALALLLTACNKTPKVELNFKAAGIKTGTIILSQFKETLLSQDIKDGAATISKPIQAPGYYDITIIDNDKPLNSKTTFNIYLENGNYTIDLKPGTKEGYPTITSGSKVQQQLSDYYKIENEIAGPLNHTIDSLLNYLDSKEISTLSKKAHSALITKTRDYQIERRKLEPKVLDAYVTKHPDNVVAAHIMGQQFMDEYPVEYNNILKKLTAEAKATEDGQKVTDKLSVLVKLLPGSEAPDIVGATPDGKAFDKRSIKAKVILVEFWVSNSQLSQMNHSKILNGLIIGDNDKKRFGVVSISTDKDQDVWKRAIKTSNLNWPQVADFKGDASPNVANWKITAVPSYFLVDSKWRIIKPNIDIVTVDDEVHNYLLKSVK
ncbi:thioredoxin-like domain-containing protein [Mucilaginibacter aquariorum]|uniref:Thioredoxin-like domain-containing protein n=1 Tax=Mucilaginibacter aquariorum TaxID=2967225 RepID=A0ABT1T731_9SPHI|nr:thioredoxin-like domain-containing protein [Mucilaginibacter aquariorum]MCQ6960436.1 thioredoxin-like domain-containing protein [Mucilaginibacter aquariorum]